MAERSGRVTDRVRQELEERPDATTQELLAAAREVDPEAVEGLSARQFNAGYVVPLKRSRGGSGAAPKKRKSKQGAGRGRGKKTATEAPPAKTGRRGAKAKAAGGAEGQGGEREAVRSILLQFAQDFSKAESRWQIVGVMSDVDRYVDRILEARG